MSPKQWFSLLSFYIVYLLFGASVFYYIERNKELEERAQLLLDRINVNEHLVKYASPDDIIIHNKVLEKVSNYCGRPVTNHTLDEYPADYRRTFYHSFWFAFIVCSTLGYGSSSPHDQRAQAFLIFYALIGLPLNGFVLTYLGDFFSRTFIGIYKQYKGHDYAAAKKFGMIARIIILLVPGIIFFIFLPACIFTYFEDWPYVTSVYYAFITLTTIGFGDYVPTFQDGQARKFGIYFTFYQIFIFLWDVIGTGYFIMIIGFIAKGMQSKRIARLEHQLSMNIKVTQNRMWTEVTKDLNFLRRILNEVNLMKFKPVYTDSTERNVFNTLPRSMSCPELTLYRIDRPRISRKRIHSENFGPQSDSSAMTSTMTLNRVQSEGDLSRIDKNKTFKTFDGSSLLQTQDLLSNILNALGSVRAMNEDEFSDSKKFTNEKSGSHQSLAPSEDSFSNPVFRKRAFSDLYIRQQDSNNEFTRNKDDDYKIQEYLRNKPKKFSIASIVVSKSESKTEKNMLNTLQVPTECRSRSFISKINPFKARVQAQEVKRHSVSTLDPQSFLKYTAMGRESKFNLTQSHVENIELLEKTTIADLIRAVEDVQAKSNISPKTPLLADYKGRAEQVSLQVPPNGSRRGSLRPVPTYTTIFTSQKIGRLNNASNTDQEIISKSTKNNLNS